MRRVNLFWGCLIMAGFVFAARSKATEEGKYSYNDFKKPTLCGTCHKEIYEEWQQSLMSQSFTHPWDDAEYFRLALPQALKLDKVAGVKSGCVGCHGPLAFLAGDIPPEPPEAGTRVNEGVSCEVCHNITGSSEQVPFNFSYQVDPGDVKYGNRRDAQTPAHGSQYSEFIQSPKLCATCHDEQSPYGAWVKETYREWKASPYAEKDVRCQDCHMYHAPGKSTANGKKREDMAHHVFHGPHFKNKLKGSVDVALYIKDSDVLPGSEIIVRAALFNGKVGHAFPSGSTEERVVWLEVRGVDEQGRTFHIPVDRKGFEGEAYTIADPKAIAYQAMGEIMEVKGYQGISRDGDLPEGARIFRRPFFDPKGRMTICQWYTAENTDIDYRFAPMETKFETYTWSLPEDLSDQEVKITATLYYSLVPSSVGKFMGLPAYAYEPRLVNRASAVLNVK